MPLLDHNVSLAYVPNEPRFLLISENRQQYIQSSDADMQSCILENHPFCQLHEPAYSTADATSCIVNLFRLQRPAIEKFCAPVIRPTNDAPKAYYLTDGKWLIVSRPPTRLTIVCPQATRTQSVIQVVEVITLDLECSATGDSLYLPPYYASETHLDLPDFQPILLRYLLLLLLLLPLGAAREPRHSPGGAPCGGGSLRPRPRRRRRLSSPVAAGGWSPEGEDGSPPGTGTSAARVPASPPPLYRRGSERLGSPRRCSQHRCRLAGVRCGAGMTPLVPSDRRAAGGRSLRRHGRRLGRAQVFGHP